MADALPFAEPIHAISGRTRLRIEERSGDGVFFASIATGLSAIRGVSHVDVRPLTGSIVIHHAAPLARIGLAAEEARLFVIADALSLPVSPPAVAIDPKIVVALGLGLFSIWQLAQGRVLPPAMTIAWYAAALAGMLPVVGPAEATE
jgi:hypothetical protein